MKTVYLVYPHQLGTIAPEIYGQFTEHIGGVIYGGIYVGKNSGIENVHGFRKEIIDALRRIHTPVIRWPGGCYAETYNWRDGIGKNRPTRINWWTNNDGKYESNEVGTNEYMSFIEAVGAKAYFAANLTSTTPLEIRSWMDYCLSPRGTTTLAKLREDNGHPEPFDIPYWGVGNENWGGGGNMRPEFYADEFRRYAQIMNNTAPHARLFACGSNAADYDWTSRVLPVLSTSSRLASGFAMHYYCGSAGDPVSFTKKEWYQLLHQAAEMESIIERNWHIICANGMEDQIKLVVDEWGCWHPDGSGPSHGANLFEQQSTMRDAVVTALTLNIFNNHCRQICMANSAQLVNNLHCLFLAEGDQCIETPTYHVYDLFQGHMGAKAIETIVPENEKLENSISVSASVKNGKTLVTLANLSCDKSVPVKLSALGAARTAGQASMLLLCHEDMHAHNTFEHPCEVVPQSSTADLAKPFLLPKASVAALTFRTGEQ